MTDYWNLSTVIVGGIATLAIFSFLITENHVYRFFEHVFIGIASGFGIFLSIENFLWPKILVPMLGLDIVYFPDGTQSKEYNELFLLYLVAMLFGLLFYTIYSTRFSWMAKIVIGFSLGISAGLAFKGFFNEMLPQITSSFKPLLVFDQYGFNTLQSLENIFFVFTLVAVMYYFFFSFRIKVGAATKINYAGRWLLMVCFGAFFGSTVMARMALLVERLQFLLDDWYKAILQIL